MLVPTDRHVSYALTVPTEWSFESRIYYFERFEEGVAERVRAERSDDGAWKRILDAVYWWPAHEGKSWPGSVVPIPAWSGVGEEVDAWSHFEATFGMDDRYRWEPR
jgi:hypothetical protein